jgi:hypothetical protein
MKIDHDATVRGRVFLVVLVVFATLTSGAVAFATTRHGNSGCRGSYTYGSGVSHCGPPCAMTAASYLATGGVIKDCQRRP